VDDAELTLRWRSDPDISRYMFTDVIHGLDEQREWIRRVSEKSSFRHFMIMSGIRPIGYLSFSDIDAINRRCATGNYIYDMQDRRSYSGLLHTFIMDYCFYRLGCHKVVNTFMAGNDRNVKIQQILKFNRVGTYKDHVYKYGRYHDVHVFELMESDWQKHRRMFSREQTRAAFDDWS
jgi:UDP-4-amino-4,6-dideoxy-N-acetyl-beta-L-altrosamine N-acetyltransferase